MGVERGEKHGHYVLTDKNKKRVKTTHVVIPNIFENSELYRLFSPGRGGGGLNIGPTHTPQQNFGGHVRVLSPEGFPPY